MSPNGDDLYEVSENYHASYDEEDFKDEAGMINDRKQ